MFHVLLLKQNLTKKEGVNKTTSQLKFNKGSIKKKYEIEGLLTMQSILKN